MGIQYPEKHSRLIGSLQIPKHQLLVEADFILALPYSKQVFALLFRVVFVGSNATKQIGCSCLINYYKYFDSAFALFTPF